MGEFDRQISFGAKRFKELQGIVGSDLALFFVCAVLDIPYISELVTPDFMDYLEDIPENAEGFASGETDVMAVVNAALDDRERWAIVWGVGDEERPYKEDDYKRLDTIFATYSFRLQRAGGMDAQQEDTLRVCSRMRLEADKALAKGGKENVEIASKLNKMIQDNLSAENLRKKDEKPIEELRVDSIVDSLEKAGMLKAGKILPLPELQKALLERLGTLGGKPSHKYPYTLDAADQMIHIILNDIRANDSLPELTDFPDNTTFDENVAPEFAEEPNKEEKETYESLGLMRWGKKKPSNTS